jgi:hypothetical protein
MIVHNGIDFRPEVVDFAVNELLFVDRPPGLAEQVAVKVEFHNIVFRLATPHAYVAVGVDDAMVSKDSMRRRAIGVVIKPVFDKSRRSDKELQSQLLNSFTECGIARFVASSY